MCTPESPPTEAPRILRNGMDYEPKKTYPPDYSNVPDIRSWQMSPFSQERFDLNEIQIAQKKGYKYQAEVEALMRKYDPSPKEEEAPKEEPKCPKCEEREREEAEKAKCGAKYLYQPYGPTVLSTASYTGASKNRLFCVSAPVFSDSRGDKNNSQNGSTPFSCETSGSEKSEKETQPNTYVPYGVSGKTYTVMNYEPMGPSLKPVK